VEYIADKASNEALKLKVCEYFANKIGMIGLATISGVNSSGLFVKELSSYAEGFIACESLEADYIFDPKRHRWHNANTNQSFRLGQRLKVQLVNVDIAKSQIEFVVA
jgi:ribonuclease R